MFSRMGSAAFKKDLTNTIALCEYLGNPQNQFKSIHIGGTNGKGSVSHMLAAIFQKAGYKTGLYTSPHLYDFRERIRINGEMIAEEFVRQFVENIKPQIEKIEPSFFEITVAMAFQAFAESEVDIAIVEVGLGGRLDSTNIIMPELSVITNIGWDHMNMLGNSLPEIAIEKAGIIKTNVPVIIGEAIAETKPVFTMRAEEVCAPIIFAEDEFEIVRYKLLPEKLEIIYKEEKNNSVEISTDLTGIYQINNVRTVLAAVQELSAQGYKLPPEIIVEALQTVKQTTGLAGRWDVLQHDPMIILEVAHNKEGINKMLLHLQQLQFQNLHFVIGMVKDKEVESVLKLLPKTASFYFTNANIPRALSSVELHKKAASLGLSGEHFGNVNEALESAIQNAASDDVIIVCGSIFLVAEVDKKHFLK